MIPALPKLVSSPAAPCLSTSMTLRPRFCRCSAAPTPTMPAPRTSTSALRSAIRHSESSMSVVRGWRVDLEIKFAPKTRKPRGFLGKPALHHAQISGNNAGHGTGMLQPCNAKSGERLQMSVRHSLCAAAIVSCVALAVSPASGQTLRYANQGELKSLDPYTLKETTTIAHHAHVYEGLVTRDKNLKMVPALAESWETPEPTRWRFHLRHNVKFHNGDHFTADDVLLSADRIRAKGSNFLSNVAADAKFVKVDDYTVDVVLPAPNPILMSQWDGW